MSLPPPPGFGHASLPPPPGFSPQSQQPQLFVDANGAGPSYSSLTPEQIEAKKRKWLQTQSKRWGAKRRTGGGGGVDGGKQVSWLTLFFFDVARDVRVVIGFDGPVEGVGGLGGDLDRPFFSTFNILADVCFRLVGPSP